MWVIAIRKGATLFQLAGDRTDTPVGDTLVQFIDFSRKN